MPPLPKKQMSKSKQRTRAAHFRSRTGGLSRCPQCHSVKPSHRVCPVCGYYRGREIVAVGGGETPG